MFFVNQETTTCDVLVIGSGAAGLRAAIAAAENGCDVLLISKARIGHATNTYLSKAIIASSGWGDPKDTGRIHAVDTLEGGWHLNNPDIVDKFTNLVPKETALLKSWGMKFTVDDKDNPVVIKIPGHTHARHLMGENLRGSDLVLPLKKKARDCGVRFQSKTLVSSLLVSEGRVCGATGISEDGTFFAVEAGAVVIATGGFGHVYQNTNNAPGITGDGQALALSMGVPLQDMEFVQFYPTAHGKRGNRILLYERILGQDGVVLKNSKGQDIVAAHGHSPQTVTRDELAQIIMKEILADPEQKGSVYMDLGAMSDEAARTVAKLLPTGWSKGDRVFEVSPTTHFCMGGIVTDLTGKTACSGLFAAGEAAAGVHGANRLGGNSLAEVIVMGGVAGRAAAEKARSAAKTGDMAKSAGKEKQRLEAMAAKEGPAVRDLVRGLRQTLWINAGILRDQQSLGKALKAVSEWKGIQAAVITPKDLIRFLEFQNMRLVGEMICRCALERTESRGSHFRSDFPAPDDRRWRSNIQVRQLNTDVFIDHVPVAGT